jgi:hypothetical protein
MENGFSKIVKEPTAWISRVHEAYQMRIKLFRAYGMGHNKLH